MNFAKKALAWIYGALASFGLACILLLILFGLTFFGTLEQVDHGLYEVQKRYFESYFIVYRLGPLPVVVPGATLCLWLLAVNLVVGGLVRIRKNRMTAGIIVVHIGILLMLAAGLVKLQWSDDGALRLFEGEGSDEYQSYYLWEVAIFDPLEMRDVDEHLIPDEHLKSARGPEGRRFVSDELPFDVTLRHFTKNTVPLQKGPMWEAELPVVEGWTLRPLQLETDAEHNVAGVYVEVEDRESGSKRETLLWGAERHPWTFEAGGRNWAMTLRHKRFSMPFTIELDDFTKEEHPGTSIPSSFMSDVTKVEDGSRQRIRIQMNEPLRDSGLVLFQSSWGPQGAGPDQPLFSVFSVVRNPSDYWPLWSCIVIAVGMLIAFVQKLVRHVKSQAARRVRAGAATQESAA